ncbi:MAG TPA: glycosyltransferase family 4 protein, partial [Paraburkholderia sp.]
MANVTLAAAVANDASRFGRVAVVHDWLAAYAGSEKVVEQILQLFPQAELYSIVDFFPEAQRGALGGKHAHTS